ncbi:MAG TPA: hypothetical protein PLB03_06460, partial [Candidatus Fimenecus sp.]|nr:hypothetical protein [Candidatus Fimenecus sp.]
MRTEEKVFFGIGTASFLLMLSDLLLEVFSASLFIGSKRLISYIGILIIVCAVSFTVLCFLVVKNHRGRFKSKGARIFLRVLSIIICIMLCLAGITIDGILYTDTVKKATSDDKRHTIIIDSEPGSGEWNMTVYRRYSPFLMSARGNGKKVVDMADENGDIDVVWTDGGCLVSYKAYKTDATSVD